MKNYVWLLFLVALIISSCNHEGPVDGTRFDQNNEVQWTVADWQQNPNTKIYHVYMPSSWCPKMASSPWIDYWTAGVKYPRSLTYNEVHNRQDNYPNYYAQEIWANYEDEVIIYLKYGDYRCQCTAPTSTAVICSTSIYAIEYDVTTDKAQKEWILGFKLHRGYVSPIDRNLILNIGADVVTTSIAIGQEATFWLANVTVTAGVGISNDNIKWEFPDGTTRWGYSFKHTPRSRGTIRITISDNLGKFRIIYKDI